MRTLAGAFATSLVQSSWSGASRLGQTEMAGVVVHGSQAIASLEAAGLTQQGAVATLANVVEGESVMLATLRIFGLVTIIFFLSAMLIWIAPGPRARSTGPDPRQR